MAITPQTPLFVAARGLEPLIQEPKSCVVTIILYSNINKKRVITLIQDYSNNSLSYNYPVSQNKYCFLYFSYNDSAKIRKKFELCKFFDNFF